MIQIIRGVYGFVDKDGIVRAKTEADGPFELLPEQEARLVNLGVAEYVSGAKASQPILEETHGFDSLDTESVEESNDIDDVEADIVEEVPLSEYSVKELRELGKEYGLTFKVGSSKADMVKAIEQAEAELAEAEEEDGEPAPVFDASEAVQ